MPLPPANVLRNRKEIEEMKKGTYKGAASEWAKTPEANADAHLTPPSLENTYREIKNRENKIDSIVDKAQGYEDGGTVIDSPTNTVAYGTRAFNKPRLARIGFADGGMLQGTDAEEDTAPVTLSAEGVVTKDEDVKSSHPVTLSAEGVVTEQDRDDPELKTETPKRLSAEGFAAGGEISVSNPATGIVNRGNS